MPTTNKTPIKTGIYIDGYNLYYGRLRGTPYKWLDVMQLFDALLTERSQNEAIEKLHIFTAPALANFATHGRASVLAQADYYRVLKTLYDDRVEIIYGNHSYDKKGALLPVFIAGQSYDRTNRVRVWKLEEKKTDVNLALKMYRDACRHLYDALFWYQMIATSNLLYRLSGRISRT